MLKRLLDTLGRCARTCWQVIADALDHFNSSDGWAIASHIALSVLLALFPFLIVVTSVAASILDSKELADEVARLLLEAWPEEVAEPIAKEIRDVLTRTRGDLLTIGVALAVFFASSGIESLRIGLSRAYEVASTRNWVMLRIESIMYVIIATAALLVFALLIVLGPLLHATARKYMPWLVVWEWNITIVRYAVATTTLVIALVIAHKWLPAGYRTFREISPGIFATMVLWIAGGMMFGRYLAEFPSIYVSYYAGLASVMIALVFLYLSALIFIFGAELNAAIARTRRRATAASNR
jgi:membrane protein